MKRKILKSVTMLTACLLLFTQPAEIFTHGFMLTTYAETGRNFPVQTQNEDDAVAVSADSSPAEIPSEATVLMIAEAENESSTAESAAADAESADAVTVSATETATETTAEALSWPLPSADIQAGSAIVMDADTGEILWGREIHTQHYPASITKLLTALIVIENCSLDETVTFSSTAVSNLESGAVTIGAVAGDELSVRDCLYALLLKSANEVANALAEHVSGSIDEFAVLMNKRAKELGCKNSDFHNPSGLTDPEHVTTAYDMGLIGIACMDNETFLELESEPTRKLAGTASYPNGLTVTIGHKMRKESEEYYDSRVVAGKTGYTSASGNTLVTMAEDRGRRLVVVVLKDKNPAHYKDTAALLNFGFNNFDLLSPSLEALLETKDLEQKLIASGAIKKVDLSTGESNSLSLSAPPLLTVPLGGGLKCAEPVLSTKLDDDAPANAVAELYLTCLDRRGTTVYVLNEYTPPESENEQVDLLENGGESGKKKDENADAAAARSAGGPGLAVWIVLILLLTALGFLVYLYLQRKAAEKRREERRRKRRERLERLDAKMNQASENSPENGTMPGTGTERESGMMPGTGAGTDSEAGGNRQTGGNSGDSHRRSRRQSRVRHPSEEHTQEEMQLLNSLSGQESDEAEQPAEQPTEQPTEQPGVREPEQ